MGVWWGYMDTTRIIPRRVLSAEEVSAILIGGYNPETGTMTDGILVNVRDIRRDVRVVGAFISALLLPVAIEAVKKIFAL